MTVYETQKKTHYLSRTSALPAYNGFRSCRFDGSGHLLLELLPGVAHVVEFLLYVDAGVVPALQQLLPEQLQRLERAGAGIHLRAMFLYHTLFISDTL